ncbi:MAG TPA: hypothetical protein PKJ98_04820 [Verrucomicrobiota bacterium]|nr:hypothetical protein [Verrucomicrobiota bacterium]
MKTTTFLVLTFAAFSLAAPAFAQRLYYSRDYDTSGGLYTLSTTTGAATWVGLSGVYSATVGLSESATGGVLYGTDPFGILHVNADGSGATKVSDTVSEGLAYDPSSGLLYSWWQDTGFQALNPYSGSVLATLADPGADVEGLAYGRGSVFGLAGWSGPRGNLYQYNISGDSWTLVGYTGVDFNETGLAYDPVADVLYAIGSQDSYLYAIDPDTALATIIGSTGLSPAGGGLAFVPVPEPAFSMAASAGALLCASVCFLRRRRLAAKS